jgi:phosphatidylserine/phosphatidylglycerophosphate/cardiolipin synthase-like enzyme
MVLASPLQDPTGWNYSRTELNIPANLDFGGERLIGIRATRAAAAAVRSPGWSALRTATDGSAIVVQMQLLPFRLRQFATRLRDGLPTFYIRFDAVSDLAYSDTLKQDEVANTDVLGTVTALTMAVAFPDRGAREPDSALRTISAACEELGGDFADLKNAVIAALAPAATAPLKLLDHGLKPLRTGRISLETLNAGAHVVELDPADEGDLQRAVVRLHAANPGAMPLASVWSGGTPVTIRPSAPAGGTADYLLAALDTGDVAPEAIKASPEANHVLITDLESWFAPQFHSAELKRYTAGNDVTLMVNGKEYFADLFTTLDAVAGSRGGGGFHLSGWDMHPEVEFREKPDYGSDLPLTLKEAVEAIGASGGQSRFLPSEFYNFPNPDAVSRTEKIGFSILMSLLLVAYFKKFKPARTNGSGAIIVTALLITNALLFSHLLNDDAMLFEPNKDAKEELDNPGSNSQCLLSEYPSTVDDNPIATVNEFPFDTLFPLVRHFGIFHQKLAVAKIGGNFVGYIGGIDLNPNRIDDARHHHPIEPYHDVHAKVIGPAVRDMALTFDERWKRDSGGSPPAFASPNDGVIGESGPCFVQVARTYFAPASPARALPFAPNGDRTLVDTMLAAIRKASQFIYIEDQYFTPPKEYRDTLLAKVSGGEIRRLLVAVPSVNDQPFGDTPRFDFIRQLREADNGRGIVYVGTPRRRYTVPVRELSSQCGMMRLMSDLNDVEVPLPGSTVVTLGPPSRIPPPPFWFSIDGELMYAYDEALGGNPAGTRALLVERGSSTKVLSASAGTTVRSHKSGAIATLVQLAGIYVHAKLMIVDDVFLSIGSANLNRRGFYHDGECNIFVLPDMLRTSLDNPVRKFRRRLWSEMADLPEPVGLSLMDDPIASTALLKRSYFYGNRLVEPEARPYHLMHGATTSDGAIFLALQALVLGIVLDDQNHRRLFNSVADPTSSLDPHA